MTFVVKKDGKTKIRLWLPTSLLKSKFIGKAIVKQYLKQINDDKEVKDGNADQYLHIQKQLYQEIKKYKRENGTLTAVEVQSADGDYVLIKL